MFKFLTFRNSENICILRQQYSLFEQGKKNLQNHQFIYILQTEEL